MSSVAFVLRQGIHPQKEHSAQPHKAPMQLAGRLLAQFEDDLRSGDQERARLVNSALLELARLMSADEVRLVERGISDAWRRACGWDF